MEDFLKQLADILEIDAVNENDVISDQESWDSLTLLSIIALADSKYHVSLRANDIKEKTAKELYKLMPGAKD